MSTVSVIVLVLLGTWLIVGLVAILIQNVKKYRGQLASANEEEREKLKSKQARKISWIVSIVLISIFGGIHLISNLLEKDLTEWVTNLPPDTIEYLQQEETVAVQHTKPIAPAGYCFVCLKDGREDVIAGKEFAGIKDKLFQEYPDAFVLSLSLPTNYTWEATDYYVLSAPLMGLSISLEKDNKHQSGGDIWEHAEEEKAHYRYLEVKGALQKVKIGGVHAFSVFDRYTDRKSVTRYTYFTDFSHSGVRYTLRINGDKEHVSKSKFKKIAKQIVEEAIIL